MQICLPRRRKRNVKLVRDQRSQDPHVTGACDLDQIRIELADAGGNFLIMFGEQKVEMVASIQRESCEAAPQLNSGNGPVALNFSSRAGMNHQERQAAASGK
jgi:hypothetical protein